MTHQSKFEFIKKMFLCGLLDGIVFIPISSKIFCDIDKRNRALAMRHNDYPTWEKETWFQNWHSKSFGNE